MTKTGVTMTVEDIPKGWRKEKLSHLLIFEKGKKPSELFDEPGHNRVKYLIVDSINDNGTKYANKDEGVVCSNEDLLIIADGSRSGHMFTGQNGLVGSTFLIIKPKDNIVNKKFLYYMLNGMGLTRKQFKKGGAIPHFDYNKLKSTIALLPTDREQEKISIILATVDKSIEETDNIIVSCEHIKKGLRQTLLTKGLPGKHKKFKKTELGEIPEDWKVESLVNVSTILLCNVDKKSHSDEKSVKLCNYIDVYKNRYITNKLDFMKATATDNEIAKFGIKIGDVLITKDSETPDDIAVSSVVIEHIDNLVCGYHLALIRPKSDKLDSLFLMNLFSNELIKNTIARKANGLTRFSLGQKTIQEIPILVPPLDEQKKIAQILTDLDARVQSEKTKKQQLIKLKLSLMQKLLSGEIRVRV